MYLLNFTIVQYSKNTIQIDKTYVHIDNTPTLPYLCD